MLFTRCASRRAPLPSGGVSSGASWIAWFSSLFTGDVAPFGNPHLHSFGTMMTETDLMDSIAQAIEELEKRGDIVIFASDANSPAEFIFEGVRKTIEDRTLTESEASSIRSIIILAINDKNFFDFETSQIIGLRYNELRNISEKLQKRH